MKRDGITAQNFNISVAITDAFIQAVKNKTTYDLINPMDNGVAGQASAQETFDLIVDSAWSNGDPGPDLHRQSQPVESHRPPGAHPGHQSLRRTAAP